MKQNGIVKGPEKDWVQCTEWGRAVCTVHDQIVPVRQSKSNSSALDELCVRCAVAFFDAVELAIGGECCYMRRR